MKFVFSFLLMILATAAMAASKQEQLFSAKEKFEIKAFELKTTMEKELVNIQGKKSFDFSAEGFDLTDSGCAEWVYQGPSNREQAARACQGVYNMECVRFVYEGPTNREESARACRGVTDMACVRLVYQGPSSRLESAQACGNGDSHPRPRCD